MRSLVCALTSMALLPLSLSGQAANDCPGRLAGVWGAEVSFGPEVRGTLAIVRRGIKWSASISGFEVPIQNDKGELSFRIPGNRGEFQGKLAESLIVGQWIQPVDSHVWGVKYATPVELTPRGKDTWRGEVVPLDYSEGIYFNVAPDSPGVFNTFVRSPERNLGRYLGPMRAECAGNRIEFVRTQNGALPLNATYDRQQEILSVYLPTESATFDLTKRDRETASGFYPRTSTADEYVYHPPLQTDDGWETASLADVGIDPKPVIELVRNFIDTPVLNLSAPYPHAFLIARHGKLVLEEYFFGFNSDRPHDTRSAGKTFMTTFVAIAMRRGAPIKLDTKATALLPQYANFANDSPAKRAITIKNLLTMTSGLDADDDNPDSPGTEDRLVVQKDRYKFTLDLPMAHPPGEKAVYSAAGINLLGGIVQQITKTWLPDFIYQGFAKPLDISHYYVPLGKSDDAYMAGGMLMRPRDFMKLGQLFLANGRWQGRQIVDPNWVSDATRPHSSINAPDDYGYGWWIRDMAVDGRTYHTYRAAGNGGQMIIAIPELDIVVTFMGGNYNQGPVWWRWNDEFVPKYIIPAALKAGSLTR